MTQGLESPRLILGIHHLKVAVSDLDRSLAFYEAVLGAERIPKYDHLLEDGTPYAYILSVPGLRCLLELRLNERQAVQHRGFDPLTLAVADRKALILLAGRFSSLDLACSPILTGLLGWLLIVEDPDELRLRFYTQEAHGPELVPDENERWLS
ncbi:VOC family protein [Sphingomonas sp. BN140010]|uniref:VOC family protein n=1 Tax=Sphingomonas arvum TaxID=2992113 RepID=A0ABT3JDQ1_9SPHN|nr:VOC family protein [Sphingomonas sp. BN140010]MCW3797193.1 VOC family protein [Sphingomonas sp. BN140010]